MKSRRRWWLLFGAGSAMVMAALVWISFVVLRLEAEAQHQSSMRLALWRMDSWLAPRLGREAIRPYFEYLPFYANQRAYTRVLNEIQPGEIYTPSPLLTYESEFFSLHFQVSGRGDVISPQAPTGHWRALAESCCMTPDMIDRKAPMLAYVQELVAPVPWQACVAEVETRLAAAMREEPEAPRQVASLPVQIFAPQQAGVQQQEALNRAEFQRRMGSNYGQQLELATENSAMIAKTGDLANEVVEMGALVSVWLMRPSEQVSIQPELVFVRRVRVGEEHLHQGFVADWPRLRDALLEQVSDLLPDAALVPMVDNLAAMEAEPVLGSIPARLESRCPALAEGPLMTPARTTLGVTWLAALGAIIASAFTLRSSITFGEKRSRFAAAVTHELRTPLTTFRMYSEMLAEGMVKDDATRRQYLDTLRSESSRLATLVENVLSYARVEDGRAPKHQLRTSVVDLVARVRPALERRAAEAGMTICVQNRAGEGAWLTTDVEVVGQILFNLVDNACKYANGSNDRRIELDVRLSQDSVQLIVRDDGPGIAPQHARVIFQPFERGAHGPGDTIPGVGLGLALARGLARDLGGELALVPSPDSRGAAFRLILPAAGR